VASLIQAASLSCFLAELKLSAATSTVPRISHARLTTPSAARAVDGRHPRDEGGLPEHRPTPPRTRHEAGHHRPPSRGLDADVRPRKRRTSGRADGSIMAATITIYQFRHFFSEGNSFDFHDLNALPGKINRRNSWPSAAKKRNWGGSCRFIFRQPLHRAQTGRRREIPICPWCIMVFFWL